jgi:hypothetical protein
VGIVDYPGVMSISVTDAQEMSKSALGLLAKPRQMNTAGRECVLEHYNWDTNLRRMERFLVSDEGIQ